MPEGLKTGDVAGEITRHKKHTDEHGEEPSEDEGREHDRVLSVIEAILLAIVALLAAYTGYASAKWSTESSVRLAGASAARIQANRAALDAENTKNFDSTTFNTWFTAYVAGNTTAEGVAARRFSPAFKVAFDAWIATQPFTNSSAPPGPTYMPEYRQPQLAQAATLDKKADNQYSLGVEAGANSDNYVRDTIYLATILFLIGISGHFRFFRIRLGLVILGGLMLTVAVVQIVTSPPIP
ncbi:MAG TPA: hypothetical protein VHT49_02770 [Acidimicrobiales bacterium]|nr:hypothetical protein [Acidimicrobiales bacterium]